MPFFNRFKSEVSKALEQFEEKEDVFIKQVNVFFIVRPTFSVNGCWFTRI